MNGTESIDRRKSSSRVRQSPAAADRRRYPRYLTFRTGKIKDAACDIECAVLDISAGGARLLAPKGVELPKEFILVIDPENSAFDCRLAWSDGQMIGVTFKKATARQSDIWLLDDAREEECVSLGADAPETAQTRFGWSVKPTDHQILKDNRRFARVLPMGLMSKTGTIVVNPDKPGIPCAIIDISANGVCLEAKAAAPFPGTFSLIYDGMVQPCRVIWTNGDRIGASFVARNGSDDTWSGYPNSIRVPVAPFRSRLR